VSLLEQAHSFILDTGNLLYLYHGESSSAFEKNKGIQLATVMQQERREHTKVVSLYPL